MTAKDVMKKLGEIADPAKETLVAGFFKTYAGGYSEGDMFLGITVPAQRKVAHASLELPLSEIKKLLASKIHEHRFTALEILTEQFARALKKRDEKLCRDITEFYLSQTARVNNWDLVDTSASYILGAYLYEFKKSRKLLYTLAASKNIWERRIAVVATQYFIARKDFKDILAIAEKLLGDTHDLIHKAVGWMLREMGKRDRAPLVAFLQKYSKQMPRTMLRYSIEHFDSADRKRFMLR